MFPITLFASEALALSTYRTYVGTAIAAKMATMTTTTIISIIVKPDCLFSLVCFMNNISMLLFVKIDFTQPIYYW